MIYLGRINLSLSVVLGCVGWTLLFKEMKPVFLKSNAVAKTKRRNRAAGAHTPLFWGIVSVALFALTTCQSGGGVY